MYFKMSYFIFILSMISSKSNIYLFYIVSIFKNCMNSNIENLLLLDYFYLLFYNCSFMILRITLVFKMQSYYCLPFLNLCM